jgi:hypothetical protein
VETRNSPAVCSQKQSGASIVVAELLEPRLLLSGGIGAILGLPDGQSAIPAPTTQASESAGYHVEAAEEASVLYQKITGNTVPAVATADASEGYDLDNDLRHFNSLGASWTYEGSGTVNGQPVTGTSRTVVDDVWQNGTRQYYDVNALGGEMDTPGIFSTWFTESDGVHLSTFRIEPGDEEQVSIDLLNNPLVAPSNMKIGDNYSANSVFEGTWAIWYDGYLISGTCSASGTVQCTIQGVETVTVPMGTFDDAVKVDVTISASGTASFWFMGSFYTGDLTINETQTAWLSPGVGGVKAVTDESLAVVVPGTADWHYDVQATQVLTSCVYPPPPRPLNDDFANRAVISGIAPTVTGSNLSATMETLEPYFGGSGISTWWTWTAPATGRFAVDTTGSSITAALAVFTGSSLSSLTKLASNEYGTDFDGGPMVAFNAVSGASYQIAVDSLYGDPGNIQLSIAPAALTKNTGPLAFQDASGDQVELTYTGKGQAVVTFDEPTENTSDIEAVLITGASSKSKLTVDVVQTGSGSNGTTPVPTVSISGSGFNALHLWDLENSTAINLGGIQSGKKVKEIHVAGTLASLLGSSVKEVGLLQASRIEGSHALNVDVQKIKNLSVGGDIADSIFSTQKGIGKATIGGDVTDTDFDSGASLKKFTIGGLFDADSTMTATGATIAKIKVTGDILGTFTAGKIEKVGSVGGYFLDPLSNELDPYTDHCFASRLKNIFDCDGSPVSA